MARTFSSVNLDEPPPSQARMLSVLCSRYFNCGRSAVLMLRCRAENAAEKSKSAQAAPVERDLDPKRDRRLHASVETTSAPAASGAAGQFEGAISVDSRGSFLFALFS